MLTNKKYFVLLIMLSLLFTSCSINSSKKEVENNIWKVITWEKSDNIGGKAFEQWSKDVSIYDWIDTEALWTPPFNK